MDGEDLFKDGEETQQTHLYFHLIITQNRGKMCFFLNKKYNKICSTPSVTYLSVSVKNRGEKDFFLYLHWLHRILK